MINSNTNDPTLDVFVQRGRLYVWDPNTPVYAPLPIEQRRNVGDGVIRTALLFLPLKAHSHAHIPARTSAPHELVAFKASAMGRDVFEVETDCITAANRAFKRSVAGAAEILHEAVTVEVDPRHDKERVRHGGVISFVDVVEAYGVACSFVDGMLGREWPEEIQQ